MRPEDIDPDILAELRRNDPPDRKPDPSKLRYDGWWLPSPLRIRNGLLKIDGVVFSKTQIEQFWSEVKKADPDECWAWTGECTTTGHGLFRAKYKRWVGPPRPAHRIAHILTTMQPVTKPNAVIQTCGLAPCCNPKHLREGDEEDQKAEMEKVRKMAAKLTDQDRDLIRKSHDSMLTLARKFEVTTGVIWGVKYGTRKKREFRWWEGF